MKNSTPGRCYFNTPWSRISSNCKWGDNQKCRRNQHENRPNKDCNSKMWLVAKSQLIQNLCGHWHGNTRGIMSMRDYREILSVTTTHLEASHHQMTVVANLWELLLTEHQIHHLLSWIALMSCCHDCCNSSTTLPCTPISKLWYGCSHTLCEGPVARTVIWVNENTKSHELWSTCQ
jgi:hypothetical protein